MGFYYYKCIKCGYTFNSIDNHIIKTENMEENVILYKKTCKSCHNYELWEVNKYNF